MDPESRAREEREELLAADDPDHDAPSKDDEEGLKPRRPAPPGRRLGSSIAMLLLVAFSLILLGGAALSGMTVLQQEPPESPSPSPPAAQDPAKAETPEQIGRSGIIPSSDAFDLRKTNFFVTDQDAQVREYEFNITRVDVDGPDGVKKSMVLVNGQSPGPLIEANSGDLLKVVVRNFMADERTTIHWHGIDQRDSVHMDGVSGVTQCGIPPGESFTYVFGVPQQRGTFWYHAHVSVQYTDGLYGPLIIHDPTEKVPQVEEDRIIMIGDMHHMDGRQAVKEYLSPSSSWSPEMSGMEPYPDNIIINGRNVFNCSQPADEGKEVSRRHEGSEEMKCASGTHFSSRIRSNTAARLRIISHSSNTPMWFTVDNHTLEIVEIDGVEVEPVATTKVFINPGQRYSAILRANQTAGNYLMRAVATCAMLDPNPHSNLKSVKSQGTAILSYDDVDAGKAPIGEPWDLGAFVASKDVGSEPWRNRCQDLPFDLAKPMRPIDAYEVGEKNKHYFMFRFVDDGMGVQRTSINGTIFSPLDNDATIWQVPDFNETSAASSNSSMPLGGVFKAKQHVLFLPDEAKGAEIAISAGNMMSHPWHLHGQQFQIVGWGKGEFGKSKTTWNLKNPLRRDTVTVGGHSHVVIRYLAENPGVWALHCHIQWHAEGGMFVQTAQRIGALKKLIDGMGVQGVDDDVRHKFCKQPGKP